jgi:hypothetical protein
MFVNAPLVLFKEKREMSLDAVFTVNANCDFGSVGIRVPPLTALQPEIASATIAAAERYSL